MLLFLTILAIIAGFWENYQKFSYEIMPANLEAQTSTPEEVQEVIAELEQYRQRLMDDTLEMAKKVKMPKQAVMKQLENHPLSSKSSAKFPCNIDSDLKSP
ncbi:hypothetical protein [Microcoleus sp. LEGE 07076]